VSAPVTEDTEVVCDSLTFFEDAKAFDVSASSLAGEGTDEADDDAIAASDEQNGGDDDVSDPTDMDAANACGTDDLVRGTVVHGAELAQDRSGALQVAGVELVQ